MPKSLESSVSPAETPVADTKKPKKRTSLAWAVGIGVPLLMWGAGASMALAHSGGPALVLFAPVLPALLLFGSGGPLDAAPEWLFISVAVAFQVGGMFLLVHGIRVWRARRSDA